MGLVTTRTLRRLLAVLLVALASVPAAARPEDDQRYRAGIGMLNKGLNDFAETELRAYLRDQPNGAQATNARYSLAVCLVRQGRHADASKELARVLAEKEFEFAPDALLLSAQCALASADYKEASKTLGGLVDRFGEWDHADQASVLLGESLYRLGRFKEAKDRLASVATRWPKSTWVERAELFCALSETSLGDEKAAAERAARLRVRAPKGEYAAHAALIEAQAKAAEGDLPAAAALYSSAAETATGTMRVEALLGLARSSRSARDYPRAERALTDAAKSAERLAGDFGARLALERGKLLLDQGKAVEARGVFASVEDGADGTLGADAAYWSAKCEIALGKFEDGAKLLNAAAKEYSKSELVPDMLFERATALSKAGKDGAAIDAWEAWRARYGSHELAPDATLAEAWCAHRVGKFDRSLGLCRELAQVHPERAKEESLRLLIAENEYAAERFEQALRGYSELLEEHTDGRFAWRAGVRRGLCLARLGRDDEAEAALRPMLESSKDAEPALRRAAITALAGRAFAKQDWARAEAWFAALAKDIGPGDETLDALLRQGICVQRQGRSADALVLFERVITSDPDSASSLHARFERGQCLIELGRLDDAKLAMQEVVAKETGEPVLAPHALRHQASIASQQGRPDEAAEILSKLAVSESSGGTLKELGSALLASEKYAEAEKALVDYLRSADAKGDQREAQVRLAIAVNRQGRNADALKLLDAIEDTESLEREVRASANYERASALRSLGRDPEAGEAFRLVVESKGTRLEPYAALELAQMESKAGRDAAALELAEDCAGSAETLEGPDGAALRERAAYLRAACLVRLKKSAEAEGAAKAFAERYPKSLLLASVRLLRGEALLAGGQAKAAASEFDAAAKAATTDEVRSSALLRSGEAWAACQEWSASEEAYTAFLDRFAGSELWFQGRFGQGWARENEGRFDAAMESYRDVVARHDGLTAARAQFQIGECLYAQKKHESAVAELLKTDVLFAYPEWSAAAIYEAGRCLAEMGRRDDSKRQFDDLKKRFPDSHWARLAQEGAEASVPEALPARSNGRPQKTTRERIAE